MPSNSSYTSYHLRLSPHPGPMPYEETAKRCSPLSLFIFFRIQGASQLFLLPSRLPTRACILFLLLSVLRSRYSLNRLSGAGRPGPGSGATHDADISDGKGCSTVIGLGIAVTAETAWMPYYCWSGRIWDISPYFFFPWRSV